MVYRTLIKATLTASCRQMRNMQLASARGALGAEEAYVNGGGCYFFNAPPFAPGL
jgi:hypothetical protein